MRGFELPWAARSSEERSELSVRARAPLRLGLAGGGTDLTSYAERFGGAVLNATIERYAYAFLTARNDKKVVFQAQDLGREEELAAQVPLVASDLALHRGVYERMMRDFNGGQALALNASTMIDAPLGSGLGASSALVVALVEAYCAFLSAPLGPYDVARLAYDIERHDLNLAGGKQDQYAAAFGGVNYIEFSPKGQVTVNPLRVPEDVLAEFESCLITCFTGKSRDSEAIIRAQSKNIDENAQEALQALHSLKVDAYEMKQALLTGNLDDIAVILKRTWQAKQKTALSISNSQLSRLYAVALAGGAAAGKVSGAGGGGFMMFLVPPEYRLGVIRNLQTVGAEAGPVKFTSEGSRSWTCRVGVGSRLALPGHR